jgi:hypothetical protein
LQSWVVPFLRLKGDPNISPEELTRELAIPERCWLRISRCFLTNFSQNENLEKVIGSVLSDLDEDIFCEFFQMPIIFINFEKKGMCQRIPIIEGFNHVIAVFFGDIRDLNFLEARGLAAHEFSHVLCGHYSDKNPSPTLYELEADAKARELGFSDEIESVRKYLKSKSQRKENEHGKIRRVI